MGDLALAKARRGTEVAEEGEKTASGVEELVGWGPAGGTSKGRRKQVFMCSKITWGAGGMKKRNQSGEQLRSNASCPEVSPGKINIAEGCY